MIGTFRSLNQILKNGKKGAGLRSGSLFVFSMFLTFGLLSACSLTVTRPVQEMADTSAALKAAKEVGADTTTPELFRRANEAYFRARNEYRMKNFKLAKEYALRAKKLAEEAEFESLRLGATRNSMTPSEDLSAPPPPAYDYPTPTGTPAFILEEKGSQTAPSTAPPP